MLELVVHYFVCCQTEIKVSENETPNLLGPKDETEDNELIKRRGKKQRKKGSDRVKGPPAMQSSIDPETQVMITK